MTTTTLLPALTPEQYASLKADIQKNGILVPVIRTEDGTTIDGHHREMIAAELGITDIPFRIVPGLGEEDRRHMAIRLNANRRQLTADQKRSLIREELRRSSDISNNWLGQLLGVDDKTVQSVRLELEDAGTIEQVTEFRCKDGKRRRYRRNVEKEKNVAEAQAPALLAMDTTSHERQVAVPTEPCASPIILPMPTSESASATLPMNPVAQTSFDAHLAARMAAHGIQGTTSAVMALMKELGVDVEKLKAA